MSFVDIDISIPGLSQALDGLAALAGAADRASGAAMLKFAQAVAAEAAREINTQGHSAPGTPPATRTGALAGSIVAKLDNATTSEVDATAFYGRFLELGTHRMKPHVFMQLAISTVSVQFSFERTVVVSLAEEGLNRYVANVASGLA